MPAEKDQDLDLDELDQEATDTSGAEKEADSSDASSDEGAKQDETPAAAEPAAPVVDKKKKSVPKPKASTKKVAAATEDDSEDESDESDSSDDESSEAATQEADSTKTPRALASNLGDMQLNLAKSPLSGKARRYLSLLSEKDLMPSFIPLDPLNPEDKEHQFCINGLVFTLPRGQMLQVPAPVASFIQETINAKR